MKKYFLYPALLLLVVNTINAQMPTKVKFGSAKAGTVKFSPSNDLIAIAVGKKVKLYRSGIEVSVFKKNQGKVIDLSFNHDGELVLAGHSNGYLTVWNTKTKTIAQNFNTNTNELIGCRFLESSTKIVTASGSDVTIWANSGDLISKSSIENTRLNTLAVSRHGRLIAVAGNTKKVYVLDGLGNRIHELKAKQSSIISLSFSPDGKKIASGGSDGSVDIWDLEKGTLQETILQTTGRICTLEFSNDGKYLAAGAESFFILSLAKDQPDVVYRKLGGAVLSSSFAPNGKQVCLVEDLVPYVKIYNISDLNIPPVFQFKDDQDNIAPQVYLSNPARIINERVNYSKDIIDIQGSIFDDYGVRILKINGIETPIRENGKFIIHLPLTMGENLLNLEATDINGNTSLKRFVINRKTDVEVYDPLAAKNYLLVVGINEYIHWPMLNNAVNDVNDLADVLLKKYNFELANVTLLKNKQATQNNIYKELRALIEKITSKDNLIIYFSGHGHFDELLNEGYWIPVDANTNSEGNYISNSSILKIIDNINSQHTFLIADACFSGSLFSESRRGITGYTDKVDKIKSRWGLASGRLEVVSDGKADSNSPFAQVLLSYLKENVKSEFAVGELIQYVKMRVSEESGQTPIGNPLRLSGDEGGEFVFRKSGN